MRFYGSLGPLGLLATYAFAQDISLLNKSKFCDDDCKATALDAAKWERSQHAHEPLDSFYTIPPEFGRSTKPGDVLRLEQHTNLTTYTVPSGLTMSRILYASQDINDTTVLASAFILWPYEIFDYANGGGFSSDLKTLMPAVGWTHGTSGIYPRCAPSNYKALQYHFITMFPLAFEGFAIIAPDYAGLGASARTNGDPHPHQYILGPSQANDLAWAIEAARKAFPTRLAPDGPFVAMGHSQGGIASWAYAERQAVKPLAGYKGTISFSPGLDGLAKIKDAIQAAVNGADIPAIALNFGALINAAITAVFPSFDYAGLSDRLYDRLNNVVAPLELCLPSVMLEFGDPGIPVEEYIKKAEWINATETAAWEKLAQVSEKKFAGPLFVVSGEKDITPSEYLIGAIKKTCGLPENKGQHIEYLEVGAMGHFGCMSASRNRWLPWIKDRIVDKPYTSSCGTQKTFVPGVDTNYTSFVGQFPPNWLVEDVSTEETWKLAL